MKESENTAEEETELAEKKACRRVAPRTVSGALKIDVHWYCTVLKVESNQFGRLLFRVLNTGFSESNFQ